MANQIFMRKLESGGFHIGKNDTPITVSEAPDPVDPETEAEEEEKEAEEQKEMEQSPKAEETSLKTQVEERILRFICTKAVEGLFENFRSEIYTEAYVKRLANQYKEGLLSYENPHLVTLVHECVENGFRIDFLGDMTEEVLLYIIREQ